MILERERLNHHSFITEKPESFTVFLITLQIKYSRYIPKLMCRSQDG